LKELREARDKKDKMASLISMMNIELREMGSKLDELEGLLRNKEQELWTLRESNKLLQQELAKAKGGEKSENRETDS